MADQWIQRTLSPRIPLSVDPEKPDIVKQGTYSLHMRRYLGCKTRLLPRIAEVVQEQCPDIASVLDVFAGTGVVGHLFNTPKRKIIVNDFLPSNYTVLSAWFTARAKDRTAIRKAISYLQTVDTTEPNYYSINYGGRFFSEETARRIGAIRDAIDALSAEPVVRNAAIADLLAAADSVALTCGHFDAFRGEIERQRPLSLRFPAIPYGANRKNEVFCVDGNELVKETQADLLYIDPPYNRRQYGTLYHVLDNIALNTKPALYGKTRKPAIEKRPTSRYCTPRAAEALRELVADCRVKHIIVSYNNMSSGGHNSNALVSREQLEAILAEKGDVKVYSFNFPSFTARRKLLSGHQEYLFYCRVKS